MLCLNLPFKPLKQASSKKAFPLLPELPAPKPSRQNWLREQILKLRVGGDFPGHAGFSCDPAGKECACNAGDPGSIPRSGRSLGEGNGSPLQYSCLENSMDRGAWLATVGGVAKESNMS